MKKNNNIYRDIIILGLPILIGQLGSIVTAFADNIMVGHYSTEAMASASFVNNVFNVAILCCVGFTYGITPLVGALFGRGKHEEIGATLRRGFRINILFCCMISLIMGILYFLIDDMGQPQELLPIIKPYYLIVLSSILFISIFNVFAQWSYAMDNSRMPMWIILGANALNIFGNWLLIYGHLGAPEMGLTGAGISTLVSRVACALLILIIFIKSKQYKKYRQGWVDRHIQGIKSSKIWSTSLPVSMQMAFETGAFSLSAVMAGWLGKIELASFQIIVIIGTLGFCIYYAIGAATSVKVANASTDNNNPHQAMRRAAIAGYHIMLVIMIISSLIFLTLGKHLMAAFSDDISVLSMSSTLIIPLVIYQLGDATQITFANALRGTSRVMPMLWIAFVSYIIIGLPSTYLLAFTAGLGLWGIILSFSVSLFIAGFLFLFFFLKVTKYTRK